MPACGFCSEGPLACLRLQLTSNVRQRQEPFRQSQCVAPTIVRDGQFRLFFFSREEMRIHVHVAHPGGEAKFWLTPSVHLAKNVGLSGVQLRQAQAVVEAHILEIEDAWQRHFGG